MATSNMEEMKDALRKIARNIDEALYSKLRDTMSIPSETYEEFDTAELYFIELLVNDELRPWYAATSFRILGYTALADNFENFANTFNFPKEEPPQTKIDTNSPEIALLKLIKQLKSDLTKNELYGLRDTKSKTFEHIFSDFLIMDKLTPSLEMLRLKLQKENREDLASLVSSHAVIISKISQVDFERTFRLCLDTIYVDIFSLLSGLRSALHKEYAAFQSLSMVTKQFSMETDFIPLTFTEEVDTRTLPLTEGSDSELQSLIENAKNQFEKKTRYIDAHMEIYSPSIQGALISLIGHPGTGKTFYCKKIINEFTNSINDAFRFVLLLSCRNSKWHTIEEAYCKNPHQTQEMIHNLLLVAVPTFNNSQELVHVILNTEGGGLLLVIDSFDEYPSQQFDSTLLYIILKRQVLTKATILITSRPGAWNKLLRGYEGHFVFKHSWQLIGFAPEQRDTFILHMLSPTKADTCHKFLANKPELNLLSLVPVNISLITGLVYSTDLLAQINTLTDVYTSLVLFKLDRQLKRLDEHSPAIYSISEMPGDMLDEFNKLAELSYEGLVARQITFSSREIQSVTSGKYTIGLGLFHIIKVMTRNLTVVDYLSCPHLTFQEFLSAWHLSQKSLSEISTIIQQIFKNNTWPAMKVCIRFLCGILTQSSSSNIIPIIINNLHKKSAPLLLTKYLNRDYYSLHSHNTASHLSVLPYVLETQDSSIIASYHQLLCPDNTTIPHFYLPNTISPVDTYCISEFLSKLPHYSIVSVLSIDISDLSTTLLDTLYKSITSSISIDTLIVIFSYSDDTIEEYAKEHLPIHIADILYEVQQDISNSQQLVEKLQDISRNPHIFNIYTLQYIMSCIKLSINSFSIQTDIIQYQPLFHFISSITNTASIHTPKHIHYQFIRLNLLDDIIINAFIDTLQSTATYVRFYLCNFTPLFMSRFVTSQPKLAYLDIDDELLNSIRRIFSHPTIEESFFIHLNELPIKGLYLSYVTLSNDSIMCDYLLSHTCLQELHLSRTTHSTPAVLSSIQHMSSLLYIRIDAEDLALSYRHSNTKESMRLYLSILNRNLLALSCVDFSASYFLTACYDSIMYLLSQCHNLQCINISDCSLTSDHMHTLATTINSLPALVYINISDNFDIRDTGLIKLYETLTNNNTIRYINLSGCDLPSSSIPVIKSLINKCASLQKINLDGNEFTSTDRVDLKQYAQQRNITVVI